MRGLVRRIKGEGTRIYTQAWSRLVDVRITRALTLFLWVNDIVPFPNPGPCYSKGAPVSLAQQRSERHGGEDFRSH